MKKIIVIGSGPVGGFMAVLCSLIGYVVIVYEKRDEFTRNINIKIENNFFKEVHEVIERLNIASDFFFTLNNLLHTQNNKILIKELEKKFSQKAKSLGALYITKEVNSFSELYSEHEISNSIVLDCTGRNSKLRRDEFGRDEENLVTVPLQNAMYINFKAKVNGGLSLYQSMKCIKEIKLSEVIVSRKKDEKGFVNVTIPAFITKNLAEEFDKDFPDISRNPVNPFNDFQSVSHKIFFPISSMIGNLIVDGCVIDLSSVSVKKIEISCGYAKSRSRENFVCLGDSAVHLAFFKSLNIGLKHGLEFFVNLSILRRGENSTLDVLAQFKRDNPLLNPIKFYRTEGANVFLIVTKLVMFGCFSYCYTNRRTERLTNPLGVNEDKIDFIREELNRKLRSWCFLLISFESKRDRDIMHEVRGNKEKNVIYDHTSWVIGLNGKSVIKISEFARAVKGKYLLVKKDFEFLMGLFEQRQKVIQCYSGNVENSTVLVRIIGRLLSLGGREDLRELLDICSSENISDGQKVNLLTYAAERARTRVGKLGLLLNVSVASVGAYKTNVNTNSSFILNIVKNELSARLNSSDSTQSQSYVQNSSSSSELEKCVHHSGPVVQDLIIF